MIKKIKWINVIKAVVFLFCIVMILHDLYMLTFASWISGELYGWTWYGLLTFILFCSIAGMIYDDFEEQIKNIPSHRPKHARDNTINNY